MTLSYFYGARIEQSGSLSQLEDIAVRRSFPQILRLLAVYYLVQGLLLAAVGVGGLLLVDQNHLLVIKQWLQVIHLDPENRSIHWLLTKVLPITDQLLETVSIGSFVCRSLVHGTQGKKWSDCSNVECRGRKARWTSHQCKSLGRSARVQSLVHPRLFKLVFRATPASVTSCMQDPRSACNSVQCQCNVSATYRRPPVVSNSIVLCSRSLTVEAWLDQWFDQ